MPRTSASLAHSTGEYRDAKQFALAFEVVLTARLWRARFSERMKAAGHTDARWTALYMIADAAGGVTQSDLADRLGVRGPTLVRLLDTLEGQGLIRRNSHKSDRRAKVISIQAKGRAALAELDTLAAGLREELFAGIDTAALENALDVMTRLSRRLEARK